jgi:hypothetical protein
LTQQGTSALTPYFVPFVSALELMRCDAVDSVTSSMLAVGSAVPVAF